MGSNFCGVLKVANQLPFSCIDVKCCYKLDFRECLPDADADIGRGSSVFLFSLVCVVYWCAEGSRNPLAESLFVL